MDYNPFNSKLRAAENELEELQDRRADLVEQSAWAADFSPEYQAAELARLRSTLDKCHAELGRLEEAAAELAAGARKFASMTPALESRARLGWNVLRWITPEYRGARTRLLTHKEESARLRGRVRDAESERDQTAVEVARLTDQVIGTEQTLDRFRSFLSVEVAEEIKQIGRELALLQRQRDHLKARAADVDRALEPHLAELRRYESEIYEHDVAISDLRSQLSGLEDKVTRAEDLDRRISREPNSYERAMLHQECERQFGDGSARAAIRDMRSQMRSIPSDIRDHERLITRLRRDAAKTEQRIEGLVERASRNIRALVVDGNNCCYEGDIFIELTALIPMVEELAKQYEVVVVFDASIRGLLSMDDSDLRAALPLAKVHVVASRVKADETILDIACTPTDWVISNDRFGDYREKAVVQAGRVIRHEILRGRVLVHDLGVNAPRTERTLGRRT